jgi:trigger factor
MHVEVPPEGVAPEYENVLQEYVKYGRVPGFRPGKAPAKVVERHYAKGIADETKDRMVPKAYREALKENRVDAVAVVDVQDVKMEKTQGLTFRVTLDVAPEFKLPKYKKIPLKENPVQVEDKEVDAAFKRLLDGYARFEDTADRPVKDGDLVRVDYKGQCDGKTVAEMTPDSAGLGEGKDFWVLCGDREFLPGFNAGLLGGATNEQREIKIRFPADYHVKAVAGKEATYTVLIKAIRQKILPEINAEFLKQFEVDSEATLRDRIKKDMLAHAEKSEKDRQKDEIAAFLLKETEFDLPSSVVEQETNLAVRSMVQRFARQGASREQIVERQDDIVNAASKSSKDRVKLSYILSRIASEEKQEVQDSEVDARVELLAKHYDMPVEKFKEELEKRNGMEGLRSDIRQEKTMDFLLEHAKKK